MFNKIQRTAITMFRCTLSRETLNKNLMEGFSSAAIKTNGQTQPASSALSIQNQRASGCIHSESDADVRCESLKRFQ